MSNTVKAENGAEVYEHRIYELVDDYISKTFRGYSDDEIKNIMRKPQPFRGMLKYIYNKLFKIKRKDIKYNNKNSNIDYSNIDFLNDLWGIYTSLCYKYLQNPTLLNFGVFTGIAKETFSDWISGNHRGGTDAASSSHCQTAKKWQEECEAALYDTAMTGNPGAMFLLKSNYGYTETPQRIEITGSGAPALSQNDIKQIADMAINDSIPDMIEALPDE